MRPAAPPLRGSAALLCAVRLPVVLLALLAGPSPARAKEDVPTLPEGPGLAARHPGDRGLARAEGVIFAEDFEEGSVQDLARRYSEVKNPGGTVLALVGDGPEGTRGARALEVTATVGENTGGHLYRSFSGVDTLFVRFYVRFLDEAYLHHFVTMGGYRPATRWPQGHAGERPRGDDRFTVAIEPHGRGGRHPAPGIWSFYDYWHEMKPSADGRHWGNALLPATNQPVPRDRWQCVEMMVRLNARPESRDGEVALWLDGRLVARVVEGAPRGPWTGMGFQLFAQGGEPFEGLSLRTTTELKANFVHLSVYVTEEAMRRNGVASPRGQRVRVRFDHVVAATRYVGPLRAAR